MLPRPALEVAVMTLKVDGVVESPHYDMHPIYQEEIQELLSEFAHDIGPKETKNLKRLFRFG